MKQTYSKWAVPAAVMALSLTAFGAFHNPATHAQSPVADAAVPTTGTWTIDPAHTNVNFGIRHMGISTVRGRFDDVAGTIVADAENPEKSSVQVTIKTASINTGITARDNHLRTADFFDAEKYPEITFKSTRVEKRAYGDFVARGDLTMHGVTRPIALVFTVNGPIKDARAGGRFGAETRVRLNRQDYGIKYNQVLDNGALSVGNQVDVTISLEATPAKPAAS